MKEVLLHKFVFIFWSFELLHAHMKLKLFSTKVEFLKWANDAI